MGPTLTICFSTGVFFPHFFFLFPLCLILFPSFFFPSLSFIPILSLFYAIFSLSILLSLKKNLFYIKEPEGALVRPRRLHDQGNGIPATASRRRQGGEDISGELFFLTLSLPFLVSCRSISISAFLVLTEATARGGGESIWSLPFFFVR